MTAEAADYRRLLAASRAILLAFCAGFVVLSGAPRASVPALLGLVAVAAAASAPLGPPEVRRLQPVLEGILAGALVTDAQGLQPPLLPYLLAPPLAAGLLLGFRFAVGTTAASAVGSLATFAVLAPEPAWSGPGGLSRWSVTMLAVGLLAAWVRRIQLTGAPPVATPDSASYAAAYRLISQLRVVARHLSAGLDTVTQASSLLQSLRAALDYDRGVLYVSSPGGLLTALATEGGSRADWPMSTEPEGLLGEAWAAEEPRQQAAGFTGRAGTWAAALPLRIGVRTIGVVALESDSRAFDWARLRAAMDLVEEAALRLETALLFDEVRSIATTEERRRVAREIHDGIAQELASLGYVVDDLAARTQELPDVSDDLRALRADLTRTITELRLSIFDLRSEVAPSVGLGTALSDYVRQVGAASGLKIHLVLDEAPERLHIGTETEVLRIAQEAITNARKHSRAANLWVTCCIEPPAVLLRVEDDGVGLGQGRRDSFGLEIMRERAARIGGQLTVTDREEGGTTVAVQVARSR